MSGTRKLQRACSSPPALYEAYICILHVYIIRFGYQGRAVARHVIRVPRYTIIIVVDY